MVLKRKIEDPRQVYLVGLIFFLVGIACEQLGRGGTLVDILDFVLPGTGIPSGMEGFFSGLSIPFLMAAIFFQLRSLRMQNGQAKM